VLLLAAAVAVGLAPGITGVVETAAARFTDRAGYAAALRDGVARVWGPVAATMRGLHDGGIGDSVTWLVVGMAAFGTLLAVVVR
jgi:hypothetical protein